MIDITALPPGAKPAAESEREPTDAEREALSMIQRCGIRYAGGEPITARRASEIICELADRIRRERSAVNQSR